MRLPLTYFLLLPILFLCIAFGGKYAIFVFLTLVFLLFLIEVKVKYGTFTKKNIIKFFNTPIIQKGFDGETVIDKSPRVSMLTGILLILGGTILVVIILTLIFWFLLA